MSYTPSAEILQRYADILIKFALGWWTWIKPGQKVLLEVPESAKPLLVHLQRSVLQAWWFPIIDLLPEGIMRDFFMDASDEQISYVPLNVWMAKIWEIDHRVRIISEQDKHELKGIDSRKLMQRVASRKPIMTAMHEKENRWEFFWTLGLYGTESMASEAQMTLEEYRQEIINACFLDFENPIEKRQEVFDHIETTKSKLNALSIEKVHVLWEDVDLHVKIWDNRQWLWWSWRNIPSFELFTSPDWRGTNGRIRFSEPLYQYGAFIKWIELHFENGIITKASTKENEQMLLDMIAVEHANKVWEFSLTDRRTSRITKFMAETLYDENVWWPYGNTHIAIWSAYKDALRTDPSKPSKEDRENRWFNDSAVHTDIVSTANRTVTATLTDGSELIIYKDGEFVL